MNRQSSGTFVSGPHIDLDMIGFRTARTLNQNWLMVTCRTADSTACLLRRTH